MKRPSRGRVTAGVEVALRAGLIVLVWRHAHVVFWIDTERFWHTFHVLGLHHLPYRNFLWEFPPLTIVPSALARILPLYPFGLVFAGLMAAAELATLVLLRHAWPERARTITWFWYVAGAPMAALAYFRIDFLASLLAVAALVAFLRGRSATGAVAAGFATKLWPAVVLAVPVVRRQGRAALHAGLACLGVVAAWWAWSPSGFHAFLRYREGAGWQVESLIGSVRLWRGAVPRLVSGAWVVADTPAARWAGVALVVVGLVAAVAVLVSAWRRETDLVAATGALVGLVLLTSRLLSPQYLVWLLPFVAISATRRGRVAATALAVSAYLTVVYLQGYAALLGHDPDLGRVLLVRNALLVLVVVDLTRLAVRAESALPAHRASRARGL